MWGFWPSWTRAVTVSVTSLDVQFFSALSVLPWKGTRIRRFLISCSRFHHMTADAFVGLLYDARTTQLFSRIIDAPSTKSTGHCMYLCLSHFAVSLDIGTKPLQLPDPVFTTPTNILPIWDRLTFFPCYGIVRILEELLRPSLNKSKWLICTRHAHIKDETRTPFPSQDQRIILHHVQTPSVSTLWNTLGGYS